MEKRKCLTFLFCLILCYSLFQHTARAQSSSQASIFSQGSITYSPSNVNLAVIPDTWGQYDLFGRIVYGADPQICFLDNNVTHNGHVSIRLDPHTDNDVNTARECDGTWYPAKPGDHIVAKCWMKIDSLPGYIFDPNNYLTWKGARIGIDFYGVNGYIDGVSGPHGTIPQPDVDTMANYVPWGTQGWVQRTIDFILPSTVNDAGGVPQIPTSIVMWAQVLKAADVGNGWFADAELYINPT
jgi:hypothetical protein